MEIFDHNNMAVISTHLTLLFSDSPTKIKLKGRHFDTTEVIEAESQVVLNILTERLPGCI
jgi:hypothetical protein